MNDKPVGNLVPRPDPTLLTTEQLRRELGSLREILESRLDAMDTATKLLSETVNRTPTEITKQITHLRELQNQKFVRVELQFKERDIRVEQASKAAKEVLDAALLAAKELVTTQNEANLAAAAKTESSFTKQIDQTTIIISTLEKAIDSRINELKERLDRGEATITGSSQAYNSQQQKTSLGISAAQVFVTLGLLVVASIAIILTIIFH